MSQVFGPFEIVKSLGAGGMAETAIAVRRGEGGFTQRVCLKRILPPYGSDKELVRLFRAEAKLAAHLVHPNICRLHDYGVIDGTFYMSMDLIEGGDLRELLGRLKRTRQPMPVDVVLLLAIDIAGALHYAHELVIDGTRAEIVHRDVSPSNVLVDTHGHFKLADFGIARARTSGHVTRSGEVKGKVPYMAPEHARGLAMDGRADLWALGVLLYECLAGERPFQGPTDLALLLAITQGQRRPIREAAPHTPLVLADLIEELLEREADARVRSARDILDRLSPITPPVSARLRLADLVKSLASTPADDEVEAERGLASTAPAMAAARKAILLELSEANDPATARLPGAPADTTSFDPTASDPGAPTRSKVARTPTGGTPDGTNATPKVADDVPVTRVRVPGRARVLGALAALVTLAAAGLIVSVLTSSHSVGRLPPLPTLAGRAVDAGAEEGGRTEPSGGDASLSALLPSRQAPTDAGVDLGVDAVSSSQAGPPEEPRAARATVEVTAVPWGFVWIDGHRIGEAHVVRRLAPGVHELAAGTSAPHQRITVTLAAGERTTYTLRAVP